MSLHDGIDTVSIVSSGIFSKTYGDGEEGAIANLYASLGLIEDVPNVSYTYLDRYFTESVRHLIKISFRTNLIKYFYV